MRMNLIDKCNNWRYLLRLNGKNKYFVHLMPHKKGRFFCRYLFYRLGDLLVSCITKKARFPRNHRTSYEILIRICQIFLNPDLFTIQFLLSIFEIFFISFLVIFFSLILSFGTSTSRCQTR